MIDLNSSWSECDTKKTVFLVCCVIVVTNIPYTAATDDGVDDNDNDDDDDDTYQEFLSKPSLVYEIMNYIPNINKR